MALRLGHTPALDVADKMSVLSLHHNNATHSPLLRLPPEVRQKIYEYALGTWEIYETRKQLKSIIWCRERGILRSISTRHTSKTFTKDWTNGADSIRAETLLTALPATCRQLHAETWMLPFKINEFVVKQNYSPYTGVLRRLNPEQMAQVKTIRVHNENMTSFGQDMLTLAARLFSHVLQKPQSSISPIALSAVKIILSGGMPDKMPAKLAQLVVAIEQSLPNISVDIAFQSYEWVLIDSAGHWREHEIGDMPPWWLTE